MSNRQAIVATFQDVAQIQSITLKPLSDDLELLHSGLDSLSFAIIIARLEDNLNLDPFSEDDQVNFPRTFGEFIAIYDR